MIPTTHNILYGSKYYNAICLVTGELEYTYSNLNYCLDKDKSAVKYKQDQTQINEMALCVVSYSVLDDISNFDGRRFCFVVGLTVLVSEKNR